MTMGLRQAIIQKDYSMEKQIRLRRKIEHEEETEVTDNNESPIACVDCHKRYPLIPGSSTCRCKWCNGKYMASLGGFTSQLAQSRSKDKNHP
jgi:hypothetical protein